MRHIWKAFLDGDKCARCGAVRTLGMRVQRTVRPGEFDEEGAPMVDDDVVPVHKIDSGVSLTKCRPTTRRESKT